MEKRNRENLTNKEFKPAFLDMGKQQFFYVFILIIIGALLGFSISLFTKPVYEAESRLITNVELVRDANITEIMVDSQLELVRELLYQSDIIDALIVSEAKAGHQIDLQYLRENTVLERRLMTTVIKSRSSDPEIATRIANSWVKIAYDRLSQAYEHALLVSEAKWMLTSIEDCQTNSKVFETAFCKSLDPTTIANLTEEAHKVILEESAHALGLTKDIQISQYQEASVPSKPIRFSRGTFVLSGGLIGLIIALIFLEFPKKQPEDQA